MSTRPIKKTSGGRKPKSAEERFCIRISAYISPAQQAYLPAGTVPNKYFRNLIRDHIESLRNGPRTIGQITDQERQDILDQQDAYGDEMMQLQAKLVELHEETLRDQG
jgi:hypothetical protein